MMELNPAGKLPARSRIRQPWPNDVFMHDMVFLKKHANCATYLASHFIVMEVHECPGILPDLPCVYKHLWEAQTIENISWTSSPLPTLLLVVEALLLLVTTTAAQCTLSAGRRDGMGNPGSDNGVGEGCFLTSWIQKNILCQYCWQQDPAEAVLNHPTYPDTHSNNEMC